MDVLNIEAKEMALQIDNGNRDEVRDFISSHETPAKLSVAIIRHLIGQGKEPISSVVNIQSLLERVEV